MIPVVCAKLSMSENPKTAIESPEEITFLNHLQCLKAWEGTMMCDLPYSTTAEARFASACVTGTASGLLVSRMNNSNQSNESIPVEAHQSIGNSPLFVIYQ
jgi:hypothetical protein